MKQKSAKTQTKDNLTELYNKILFARPCNDKEDQDYLKTNNSNVFIWNDVSK